MNFLSDFGVQPILLAAQVVNFFILLFILKKFLYGPILEVLEKRKQLVVKTLKNAEESERILREAAEKGAETILKGAKEGERIIREATEYAVQLVDQGKKDYQNLINKGVEDVRKMHEAEKEILLREVKGNVGGLVLVIFEKIIGKPVREDQRKMIEKEAKNLS